MAEESDGRGKEFLKALQSMGSARSSGPAFEVDYGKIRLLLLDYCWTQIFCELVRARQHELAVHSEDDIGNIQWIAALASEAIDCRRRSVMMQAHTKKGDNGE